MKQQKTIKQTHVRITKIDKRRLNSFMIKNRIKSQATALRKIFNKAKI